VESESGAPATVLSVLSLGGYCQGLVSLAFHWVWFGDFQDFFNANLGRGDGRRGCAGWIGVAWPRTARASDAATPLRLLAALGAIDCVGMLLTWREVAASGFDVRHAAFANAEFATALVGLAIPGSHCMG